MKSKLINASVDAVVIGMNRARSDILSTINDLEMVDDRIDPRHRSVEKHEAVKTAIEQLKEVYKSLLRDEAEIKMNFELNINPWLDTED